MPDNVAPAVKKRPFSWRWMLKAVCTVLFFLMPAFLGFGNKLKEFFMLLGDDSGEGAFALAPILNYLLASLGFFFLMIWAVFNGMFRDIQAPADKFMETEAWLDEQEHLQKVLHGSAP